MTAKVLTLPIATYCPVCEAKVDRLQGSPRRPSHIVFAYPCNCALTPEQAQRLGRMRRNLEG